MPIDSPRSLDESSRIAIATQNDGKVVEIRQILAGYTSAQIVSLEGQAVVYPEEGDDYQANAIGKARAVAEQLGIAAIGDDSGIEVRALGNRPGVRSARYGGAGLDDRGRVALLLRELAEAKTENREARFVCHVALALPDGSCFVASGECRGAILREPRGESGFGYDPVFQADGETQAMAALPEEEKNRLSHRGNALRALFGGNARRLS